MSLNFKQVEFGKTNISHDGFYSNEEMQKVRDEIESNAKLDLNTLSGDFEKWVNTEVSESNSRHLNKPENKKLILELSDELIKKYPDDFDEFMSTNPIYVVQFILKHEYKLTGKNSSDLALDGKFGINTFYALINFQKEDLAYFGINKKETATGNIEGGRPDGVANGRTLEAFLIKLKTVVPETQSEEAAPKLQPDEAEPEEAAPKLQPDEAEPEKTEAKSTAPDSLYTTQGDVLLVGKDIEGTIDYRNLSPEMLEKIKQYEKLGLLNSILNIWLSRAKDVSNGQLLKRFRDSGKNIDLVVGEIEKKFVEIVNNINTPGYKPDDDINWIFSHIQTGEDQSSIVGNSDMKEVQKVFNDTTLNKDQKMIKMLNLMRYKGLSGNSVSVKEEIAHVLLQNKEFKSENDILNNNLTLDYIKNNKVEELKKLGIPESIITNLVEAYNKINAKNQKLRAQYQANLPKVNEERKNAGMNEYKDVDEYIKVINDASIMYLLKHDLLRYKLSEKKDRGNEESYSGMYANLTGLAQNNGGFNDIFIISDENIDTAIDVGVTVALSAVSMGAGALAARGAMIGVTALGRTARLSNVASRLNSGTKMASTTKFIGTAGIEGTTFYEGTNLMNNIIYNEGNIFENGANGKEIVKSIAFMGVLRGVGKMMENIRLAQKGATLGVDTQTLSQKTLAGIGNLTDKVPPLMLKGTSVTGVLAEAGLLTGTSIGLEVYFEGEGEWTWEEYLQAVVMVGLVKTVGKIKITKSDNGEIKLIEYKPMKQIEHKPIEQVEHKPIEQVEHKPIKQAENNLIPNETKEVQLNKMKSEVEKLISVRDSLGREDVPKLREINKKIIELKEKIKLLEELPKTEKAIGLKPEETQTLPEIDSKSGQISTKVAEETHKTTPETKQATVSKQADPVQQTVSQQPTETPSKSGTKIDFEGKGGTPGELNILPKEKLISEINAANTRINNLELGEKAILGTKTDGNHLEIVKANNGFIIREYAGNSEVSSSVYNGEVQIKVPSDGNFIVPELTIGSKHYGNIKQVEIKKEYQDINFERQRGLAGELKILEPKALKVRIKKANESIASLEQGEKVFLGTKTEGNYLEITKNNDGYVLQQFVNGKASGSPIATSEKLEIKQATNPNLIVPELKINYGNTMEYGNIKEVLFRLPN